MLDLGQYMYVYGLKQKMYKKIMTSQNIYVW